MIYAAEISLINLSAVLIAHHNYKPIHNEEVIEKLKRTGTKIVLHHINNVYMVFRTHEQIGMRQKYKSKIFNG